MLACRHCATSRPTPGGIFTFIALSLLKMCADLDWWKSDVAPQDGEALHFDIARAVTKAAAYGCVVQARERGPWLYVCIYPL